MRAGRVEEALGHYERALVLMRNSLGPDDPQLAFPLHNMALAQLRRDRPDLAQALVKQALELRRRGLGPHHARTLDSTYQLAYVQVEAGELEAAHATYEDYLAQLLEHRPDDVSSQVYAKVGLSDVALRRDRPAEAQAQLDLARALLGTDNEDADLRAAVAFSLAHAHEAQGHPPARARAYAEEALQLVRDPTKRAQIEDWLADRPM